MPLDIDTLQATLLRIRELAPNDEAYDLAVERLAHYAEGDMATADVQESASSVSTSDMGSITGQRLTEEDGEPDLEASEALANLHAAVLNALEAAGDDTETYAATADDELDGSGWNLARSRQGGWHAVRDTEEVQESRRYSPSLTELLEAGGERAPKGGIELNGKAYRGGQFIPGKEIAKASPEDKAKLEKAKADSETKAKAKSAERKAKPVDRASLADRLSKATGGRKLLPSQERSAAASWRMLQRFHGDEALHRVQEIADAAEAALGKLDRSHPAAVKLRQRLGELAWMAGQTGGAAKVEVPTPDEPEAGAVADRQQDRHLANAIAKGVEAHIRGKHADMKKANQQALARAEKLGIPREQVQGMVAAEQKRRQEELAAMANQDVLNNRDLLSNMSDVTLPSLNDLIDMKPRQRVDAIAGLLTALRKEKAELPAEIKNAGYFAIDTAVSMDPNTPENETHLASMSAKELAGMAWDAHRALQAARALKAWHNAKRAVGKGTTPTLAPTAQSQPSASPAAAPVAATPDAGAKAERGGVRPSMADAIAAADSGAADAARNYWRSMPRPEELTADERQELNRQFGELTDERVKRAKEWKSAQGAVGVGADQATIQAARDAYAKMMRASDAEHAAREWATGKLKGHDDVAGQTDATGSPQPETGSPEEPVREPVGVDRAGVGDGDNWGTTGKDTATGGRANTGAGGSGEERIASPTEKRIFDLIDGIGGAGGRLDVPSLMQSLPGWTKREEVQAALASLEKAGKIKQHKGGYVPASFTPDPQEFEDDLEAHVSDEFRKIPKAKRRGMDIEAWEKQAADAYRKEQRFTGTDAQGRQWVNGELVAKAKQGQPQATSTTPPGLDEFERGMKPPADPTRFDASHEVARRGDAMRRKALADGKVPEVDEGKAWQAASAAWTKLDGMARRNEIPLPTAPKMYELAKQEMPELTRARFYDLLEKWQKDDRLTMQVVNDPHMEPEAHLMPVGAPGSSREGQLLGYLEVRPQALAKPGEPATAAPGKPSIPDEAKATATSPADTPGTPEHFKATVLDPMQASQQGKPLYPQQIERLAARYNARHGTNLDVTRKTPPVPTGEELKRIHAETGGKAMTGEKLQNIVDRQRGGAYAASGDQKPPAGETKVEPIRTKTSGGADVVLTPHTRSGSVGIYGAIDVDVNHPTLGQIRLEDPQWVVANRQGQWALVGKHKGQKVAVGVPKADYERAMASARAEANRLQGLADDRIKSGEESMSIHFQHGEPLSAYSARGRVGEMLSDLGLAKDVMGWGLKVDDRVHKELGEVFTYAQAKELSDRIHAPRRQAEAEAKARAESRRQTAHAEAKRTGQKQMLSRDLVGESNSGHIFRTTWIHPDGTTSTTEFRE